MVQKVVQPLLKGFEGKRKKLDHCPNRSQLPRDQKKGVPLMVRGGPLLGGPPGTASFPEHKSTKLFSRAKTTVMDTANLMRSREEATFLRGWLGQDGRGSDLPSLKRAYNLKKKVETCVLWRGKPAKHHVPVVHASPIGAPLCVPKKTKWVDC